MAERRHERRLGAALRLRQFRGLGLQRDLLSQPRDIAFPLFRKRAQPFQFAKLGSGENDLRFGLGSILHHPFSQLALLCEQVLDVVLEAQLRMRFGPEVGEAYEAEEKHEVVVAAVAQYSLELGEQRPVLLR